MIEIIQKYINTEVKLGQHDCLTLMLEALDQQDVITAIRKRYTTMAGARRVLPKIVGYPSPKAFLCDIATPIDVMMTTTGDIVTDGEHFGLIFNGQILAVQNNTFTLADWVYDQSMLAFRRK